MRQLEIHHFKGTRSLPFLASRCQFAGVFRRWYNALHVVDFDWPVWDEIYPKNTGFRNLKKSIFWTVRLITATRNRTMSSVVGQLIKLLAWILIELKWNGYIASFWYRKCFFQIYPKIFKIYSIFWPNSSRKWVVVICGSTCTDSQIAARRTLLGQVAHMLDSLCTVRLSQWPPFRAGMSCHVWSMPTKRWHLKWSVIFHLIL